MNSKPIECYELIDGKAIIDSNFIIVYANESLYRFLGIATSFNIMDVIHQVDFDDFADVVNMLQNGKSQTMVVRMRRIDNSYRWMLLTLKKNEYLNEFNMKEEYLEIDISDIYALKKQNTKIREVLDDYSHLMALESELMYTYYFETGIINIFHYVDNDIITILEQNFSNTKKRFEHSATKNENDAKEFEQLCEDITSGKTEFTHSINFLSAGIKKPAKMEIKGSTVYRDMKPVKVVGSIRNCENEKGFTLQTFSRERYSKILTKEEVHDYIKLNIEANSKCALTFILIQVNDFERYGETDQLKPEKIYSSIFNTARLLVGNRGVVGKYEDDTLFLVVKDICEEVYTRAFVESLRSRIFWDYKHLDSMLHLTLSIGISRYPFNGKYIGVVLRKMVKALDISNQRGKNKFIIYKENLHGELR